MARAKDEVGASPAESALKRKPTHQEQLADSPLGQSVGIGQAKDPSPVSRNDIEQRNTGATTPSAPVQAPATTTPAVNNAPAVGQTPAVSRNDIEQRTGQSTTTPSTPGDATNSSVQSGSGGELRQRRAEREAESPAARAISTPTDSSAGTSILPAVMDPTTGQQWRPGGTMTGQPTRNDLEGRVSTPSQGSDTQDQATPVQVDPARPTDETLAATYDRLLPIAKKLNKSVDDLTEEDVRTNYSGVSSLTAFANWQEAKQKRGNQSAGGQEFVATTMAQADSGAASGATALRGKDKLLEADETKQDNEARESEARMAASGESQSQTGGGSTTAPSQPEAQAQEQATSPAAGESFSVKIEGGATVTVTPETQPEIRLAEIAKRKGVNPLEIPLAELVQAGMPTEEAQAAIASLTAKAMKQTPYKEPAITDWANYEPPAGAPSPLSDDLQAALDRAKKLIKDGDLTNAAKALVEASKTGGNSGMSEAQALENIVARQEGRSPVNVSSPDGLWDGTASKGNPSGAPTDVIRDTATPEQKKSAASYVERAIQNAKRYGLSLDLPSPSQAASATPMPKGEKTWEDPKPSTKPPVASSPSPAAKALEKPQAKEFEYKPNAYALDEDKATELAKQRAAMMIDPRLASLKREYDRRIAEIEEQEGLLPGALQEAMDASDSLANRSGMLHGGRRLALRAKALAQAQRDVGLLAKQRALASRELADATVSAESERGMIAASELDRLRRDDRDFQARERSQQFGEFASNRAFETDDYRNERDFDRRVLESDRSHDMAREAFDDQYKSGGVGYAQRALALATGKAEFNDRYTAGGVGFQQRSQDLLASRAAYSDQFSPDGLGYKARLAEYNDKHTPEGIGYKTRLAEYNDLYGEQGLGRQSRVLSNKAAELANTAAQTRNVLANLELQLAQATDVGLRRRLELDIQQSRKNLDLIDSQILENQSQAAKALKSSQLAAEKEAEEQAQKQKDSVIRSLVSTYRISPRVASLYTDFEEFLNAVNSRIEGFPEQEREIVAHLQTPEAAMGEIEKWAKQAGIPLDATDKKALRALIMSRFGASGAADELDTLRKGYDPNSLESLLGGGNK